MSSRAAWRTIEALAIFSAFAPGTGLSQAGAERARVDDKERIAEQILAAQAKDGPRSPDLIRLLTDLGVLFETEGQHALAIAALEQARQLVRANYGLHNLDQVPLLQQALANRQALGDSVAVRAIEEELLDLAARHPDDLRSAAIHRDAGKRRQDVLRRFLAGEAPGEVYPEAGFYSFFRDELILALASEAQIHFADAAAVMLRNGLYASAELRDVEMEIVRASDTVRQQSTQESHFSRRYRGQDGAFYKPALVFYNNPALAFYDPSLVERMNTLTSLANSAGLQGAPAALKDAFSAPSGGGITSPYQVARDSYHRVIAYDEAVFGDSADEASLRGRLEAYLQIADWDLLYSQNGVAFDQYARVHDRLKTTESAEPLIAELFAPPIPIVLPAFQPNPLETAESTRYIDVAFEVTKYGESQRVEIASAAADVSATEKDDLVSFIKRARFRPRVADGELGRAAPVVVRYYLGD